MMNKLSESRLLLESHFLMKIRPLFLQNSPTALVIKRERKKVAVPGKLAVCSNILSLQLQYFCDVPSAPCSLTDKQRLSESVAMYNSISVAFHLRLPGNAISFTWGRTL